jgi:hypothetical protein
VLASADSAVVKEAHRCNRDFYSIMPDVVEIAPALGVDMMNDNRFSPSRKSALGERTVTIRGPSLNAYFVNRFTM